ncbi:MAG: 5'/3'-nucleotidase SurE [Flavobacteriaceae bacterium]|jgi:5'-nucleotidase|nr:5'/3'-nucleotidase SurE [Flavobacteriaceae bacterium]|tara:strand:+ start:1631 stop:2407 length:777 start_codon:yes stop_codon:yes gene_type:complete
MSLKPLILVTNDDGITAPGIRSLVEIMNSIGEVVVVAPDSPKSAMSHAITVNSTLHCSRIKIDSGPQKEYSCSGTPADCVKIAVNELLSRKPDICVSGINHGSNSSINVIYSGTMSAAIEAGIQGIPSLGFSLLDYKWSANFEPFTNYVKSITLNVLKNKISNNIILNVNMPRVNSNQEIKGVRICRQAKANWIEKFDKRKNPIGKEYYWLTGEFIDKDTKNDTDEWALKNNYISIVPVQFDFTAYDIIQELNTWDFE